MLLRRSDKGRWIFVTAMAGAAGKRGGRLLHLIHCRDLGYVVFLDVFGHGVHDAGHGLLILGVERKIELGAAVGSLLVGIGGVTIVAMNTEIPGPSVHNVADLFAGQILRQHFQIGGRGKGARRWPPPSGGGPCGACATEAAAKMATDSSATVEAGRNREGVFKQSSSFGGMMLR